MAQKPICGGGGSRAWIAAILAIVAVVYARCLGGEFVLDDHKQLVANTHLAEWSFIWKSFVHDSWWFRDPAHLPQSFYYRPLQNLWFALNIHAFGLNPAGWHAAMIVLHLIVVWLVYRIAITLCADEPAALIAAAMFGLMPIHAESVVWASAVGLVAAVFELAAFDCYLAGTARGRLLSLALFGGALLSLEGAAVFPGLVAAHAFLLGQRVTDSSVEIGETRGRRFAAELRDAIGAVWPYAAVLVAYLIVRFAVLGFLFQFNPDVGARLSPAQMLLAIPPIVLEYSELLAIPWLAGPYHPFNVARSITSAEFWLPAAIISTGCGALIIGVRNRPHRRLYLFCAAWFAIAIGPVVNLGDLAVRDRYVYLPSVAVCIMAADLAVTFARESEFRARAVWIGALTLGLAYIGALFHVQHFWNDDVSLYSRYADEAPTEGIWHNRKGMAMAARGDYTGARTELNKALALEPDAGENLYYDLALLDARLGDRKGAAAAMGERLKRIKNPTPDAYAAYALAADSAGDTMGADEALRRAATLAGGAEAAAIAHAQISFMHRDYAGAESALHDILAHDPDNGRALALLGMALAAENHLDAALVAFRRASALAPRDPNLHYRVALTLHQMGDDREARTECANALAVAPNNPDMMALMAAIEAKGAAN